MSYGGLRLRDVRELPAAMRVQAQVVPNALPAPSVTRKPRRDSEHQEQVVFFNRIRALADNDSRYMLAVSRTFAIPNGGGRSKREAGRLKAEGVKAGVSDIFVAVPSGEHHGLWIEMKSLTGYPSREQRDWIGASVKLGYAATCCRGADLAFATWKDYVDGVAFTATDPQRSR